MKKLTACIALLTLAGCIAGKHTTSDPQAGRPPSASGDNGPYGTNIQGGNSGSPPPAQPATKPKASMTMTTGSGAPVSNAATTVGGTPVSNATCVTGIVETASHAPIPVAAARVTFNRDGTPVGEASTDEHGRFAWCAPRAVEAAGVKLTMHVDKGSFAPINQPIELVSGATKQVTVDMFLRE